MKLSVLEPHALKKKTRSPETMTTAADVGVNSPGPGLVQPYENIALHY